VSNNTVTVQFEACYLADCCAKRREFVVEFSTVGMADHRDLEAAMVRHAKIHAPTSEHIVTFAGVGANWRHVPKLGPARERFGWES